MASWGARNLHVTYPDPQDMQGAAPQEGGKSPLAGKMATDAWDMLKEVKLNGVIFHHLCSKRTTKERIIIMLKKANLLFSFLK